MIEGASKYPEHESGSDSEPDDLESGEGMSNPLSKWRKVKIAVAADVPVWIGIEAERESSKGGAKYKFGVAGGFGFDYDN